VKTELSDRPGTFDPRDAIVVKPKTSTSPEQPLGPRKLDLGALTDEDFELLCFLVVLLEHAEAVKLANPDGGADAALPTSTSRDYARCWQFKRYPGTIYWAKCIESLDRAVRTYGMPHYTFCFARDLTTNQEHAFKAKLVGRHAGVTIDYWNHSRLVASLIGSEHGGRIVKQFYGDPAVDAQAIARALRAGGELASGSDALDRLAAVGTYLAGHDPFFTYPTSTRESDAAPPAQPTPGSIMAVEQSEGLLTTRIEAIPRNAEALDRYLPSGKLSFPATEEGRRILDEFVNTLRFGGEATLRGVSLEFDRLPPLFQAMEPAEPPDEIIIRAASGPPAPWDASFRATKSGATLAVDLRPVDPPPDWDGALRGARGGLEATLLMRRRGDGGEMTMNWSFREQNSGFRDQADALALLEAIYAGEPLDIGDRTGGRPTFTLQPETTAVPEFISQLKRLSEDLATIEAWTGESLRMPNQITGDELRSIAEAAYIIRSRKSRMNFAHVVMDVEPEKYKAFAADPSAPLRLELVWGIDLFGRKLPLGKLCGDLTGVDATEVERIETDGKEVVRVRLEPRTDAARAPLFELEHL
jgi:hypothetical protein